MDGEDLNIKGYKGGMSGSSEIKKVGENTYIGQDNSTIDEEKDEVTCKLNIREIEATGSK